MKKIKIISISLLLIICSACSSPYFVTQDWYKNGTYPNGLDKNSIDMSKMEVFGKATVYVNGIKTNRCSIVANGRNNQIATLDDSNLFYLASNDRITSLSVACYDQVVHYIGGLISGAQVPSSFFYKDLEFTSKGLGKAYYAGDIDIYVQDPANKFGESGPLGLPRELEAKIIKRYNLEKAKEELKQRFNIEILNPIQK
jgi:hypothetical protein